MPVFILFFVVLVLVLVLCCVVAMQGQAEDAGAGILTSVGQNTPPPSPKSGKKGSTDGGDSDDDETPIQIIVSFIVELYLVRQLNLLLVFVAVCFCLFLVVLFAALGARLVVVYLLLRLFVPIPFFLAGSLY